MNKAQITVHADQPIGYFYVSTSDLGIEMDWVELCHAVGTVVVPERMSVALKLATAFQSNSDLMTDVAGLYRVRVNGDIIHLDLSRLPSNGQDLIAAVLPLFPSIRSLDCSGLQLSDEALVAISQLNNLEVLTLSASTIAASGITSLERLRCLRHLVVRSMPQTLIDSLPLGLFSHLWSLTLDHSTLSRTRLLRIREAASELRHLGLAGFCLSVEDMLALGCGLQSVDVSQSNMTNDAVAQLLEVGSLRQLDVSGSSIDDELANSKRIGSWVTDFRAADTSLSDRSAELFAEATGLQRLYVSGTHVSRGTLRVLASTCTRLTHIALGNTDIANQDMRQLAGLQLEELWINGTAVNDRGLVALGKCPRLKTLSLEGCSVTGAGLMSMDASKLCRLDLAGTNLLDEGAWWLGAYAHLLSLDISRTKASPDLFVKVASMTELVTLHAVNCDIQAAGVKNLTQNIRIRTLRLSNNSIGEQSIRDLGRMGFLFHLELLACNFSATDIQCLKRLVPWTSVDA